MRLAYHPNAATMTAYALNAWAAQSAVDVFSGGGVVVTVSNPKHPYRFGVEVVADDRETQGGNLYSRVRSVRRRGTLEFPVCTSDENNVWVAWYLATLGGRVQFMIEEPETLSWVLVKCKEVGMPVRTEYQMYQPPVLELIEWL